MKSITQFKMMRGARFSVNFFLLPKDILLILLNNITHIVYSGVDYQMIPTDQYACNRLLNH